MSRVLHRVRLGLGEAIEAWGRASNEQAVRQARAAATEASRAVVERGEVALWLQAHDERDAGATADAGPVRTLRAR